MAHRHASSGEVVDLMALGDALEQHVTHALIKSAQLELVRLVLPAGKALREHRVAGEITVLCVEGVIDIRFNGSERRRAARREGCDGCVCAADDLPGGAMTRHQAPGGPGGRPSPE